MDVTYEPAPGSPKEIARFRLLQEQLRDRYLAFCADTTQPYTAVIIPSQSVDPVELAKIEGVAHYEERSLFNLMLLRHPRLRIIYVTSKRLDPLIVDYFLHQMRGVPSAHARRRLVLLDCDDASARPLTQKVLERPRLVQRIRDAIDDPVRAHMGVFNTTPLERTLAVQLNIPINASDPDLTWLGSKTGARRVFREAEVPLPAGREGLRDTGDLVDGILDTVEDVPDSRRLVVKLNDSFSGEGNAVLDLAGLNDVSGREARQRWVREALPRLRFEAKGQTWGAYETQFSAMGGICEQWLEGARKTSPSVQLRVNPIREVQVVSTHDQVLGGPSGQVFLGATFPAEPAVRDHLRDLGRRVGHILAREGVVGRSAVDFVATFPEGGGEPTLHALEINLRQGGTTHPYNTLKFLTDGNYNEETGEFFTAQGQPRAYFTTDTLSSPNYRGVLPFDLLNLLVVKGIHFRSDETGVVFHLLGCLSRYGKLGCLSIAPTVDEARRLHREMVALLDEATSNRMLRSPE